MSDMAVANEWQLPSLREGEDVTLVSPDKIRMVRDCGIQKKKSPSFYKYIIFEVIDERAQE